MQKEAVTGALVSHTSCVTLPLDYVIRKVTLVRHRASPRREVVVKKYFLLVGTYLYASVGIIYSSLKLN